MRRSPHGERGLKFPVGHTTIVRRIVALLTESVDWNDRRSKHINFLFSVALLTESVDWNHRYLIFKDYLKASLSSRRAWIEILYLLIILCEPCSRSPHGERGLKWDIERRITPGFVGRSPHGERGLKSWRSVWNISEVLSLSSRRAWIEISYMQNLIFERLSRSPHGERGLKFILFRRSHLDAAVALLTESVDWNFCKDTIYQWSYVALLTESVDWNRFVYLMIFITYLVALLTESVDWNQICTWIMSKYWWVALLTESVDWNIITLRNEREIVKSLSSRRAWIEISSHSKPV